MLFAPSTERYTQLTHDEITSGVPVSIKSAEQNSTFQGVQLLHAFRAQPCKDW